LLAERERESITATPRAVGHAKTRRSVVNGVTVTTKKLGQLRDHFENNELVLPEIQRDFVWKKSSVLALFDSLYRGFPIGHMLVWKTSEVVPEKRRVGNKLKRASFYGCLLCHKSERAGG
jgi:hypothetical protein